MDIVASILAYLGCVTGIVAALAMSLFVVFSNPAQPNTETFTVTGVEHAKPIAKSAPEVGPPHGEVVAQSTEAASELRKAEKVQAQHAHRLIEEERARRWAYQKDPDFETRFLSYTD